MDTIAKVYITKDYSVKLYDDDIEGIASYVRKALYDMPRPTDYSVADILTQVDICAGAHIEVCMEYDTEKSIALVTFATSNALKKIIGT